MANSVFGEEDEVTSVGRESHRKPRFHSEPRSRVLYNNDDDNNNNDDDDDDNNNFLRLFICLLACLLIM